MSHEIIERKKAIKQRNGRGEEKSFVSFCRGRPKANRDEIWGQFHQRVYAQLLRPQIPKAQKAA